MVTPLAVAADDQPAILMSRFTSTRYQRLESNVPERASGTRQSSTESFDNQDVNLLVQEADSGDSPNSPSDHPQSDEDESYDSSALLKSGKTLALGVPGDERRFFFQRSKVVNNAEAIATQASVFDNPETLEEYRPGDDWENIHRFDPDERWTWDEEHKLIRKIDSRIMIFAAVMFMALELDRSNISQALTDNFLEDLGMTTNDYNAGQTAFRLAFLCAELPSQLLAKWIGPDIWIPSQMVVWSIVASGQFFLVILYLSYFYKHHELSLRLGFFYTASALADVMGGFLAFGILHMRGFNGHAGWRWLFLIEALLTLIVGLLAFVLMPSSPTSTSSWFRGEKGWFTEREEKIMVNRIIREDPSKGLMHNREPLTLALLWQSMKDFDLWPIYILGLNFQTPMTTPANYLTLSLKGLGFDTFKTNLLVIPNQVFHVVTMLALTYAAEVFGELTFTALIGQIWALPFLVFINIVDISQINKWLAWAIMTALLSFPNAHPMQVGWNSRNSNTVRSRTVSAALYNMCVQTSGIVAANIYREDDAPRYKRGNHILLSLVALNIFLYLGTKLYYVKRNAYRDKIRNGMSEDEKLSYISKTTDEGNKRLDFRFAH
ncbi:related to nicotinamide mononucleotide permease [Rhynchosporium secalis]|uniref:Related to nicotinamide mononucleotide permease n=1 Tax=Rhynchosporium secalis TaxID=38038 RepID=A0A1E1MJD8_RHYSE|nr:related to nicotinamide mononucleotide permease [Rhynchosporium secalis]